MSKYIIEIAKEYEEYFKGVLICGIADGKFAVDVIAREDLEELNSDYINEHYGSMQDEAYQRGLEDAWEAARKIILNCEDGGVSGVVLREVFDTRNTYKVINDNTASEAIAKLKAYEDKQKDDDHIKVGDEVINNTTGTKGILLEPETEDLLATVVVPNHRWNTFNMSHINLTKTGRHFDIEGILEEMRND